MALDTARGNRMPWQINDPRHLGYAVEAETRHVSRPKREPPSPSTLLVVIALLIVAAAILAIFLWRLPL
jgi:hypothetical protein